jgi:predicted AlkP superfamily pyrophosphatase or phosphodiesterase
MRPHLPRLFLLIGIWHLIGLASGLVVAAPTKRLMSDSPALAEHVVVVVWDGLRPDSVNEQDTPTLFKLAKEGTTFAQNHCVYISSTEVNGTAIATGGYPSSTGIVANTEYRPEIDPLKSFGTEEEQALRKGDELSHDRYIGLPTVAEILQRKGRWTAIAGSKPVALMLDRQKRSDGVGVSGVLFQGKTMPESLGPFLVGSRGEFPKTADATMAANREVDVWTTQALVENMWANGVPAFSMLWLSEPDYAQHGSGPNSAVARAALKSCDENLERVLKALEAAKARSSTAVFVVSDHGFSTISRAIDTAVVLNDAGFHAFRKFPVSPAPGSVMVIGNGGTVCLYVVGRDKRTVQRLVEFLQESDFAGVIFCRFEIEGTFPLAAAKLDSPTAPDIVVSLRWTSEASRTGMVGMVASDAKKRGAGQGIHASLSRFDMHNTLIAAGPGIRRGFVDNLPSGNADVAPTALALLGISAPGEMDGRVLTEALAGHERFTAEITLETLEAGHRGKQFDWHQYLQLTKLGRQLYLDEGNGEAKPVGKSK